MTADASVSSSWVSFRWTSGVRFRKWDKGKHGATGILRETAGSVVFSVPEMTSAATNPTDPGDAALVEMDLGNDLHLCLLVYAAQMSTQDGKQFANLTAWLRGNWKVDLQGEMGVINRPQPGNTIVVGEPRAEELLDNKFFNDDGSGNETEYQAYSRFEYVGSGSGPEGRPPLLAIKPQAEHAACFTKVSPKTIRKIEDIASRPLPSP